MDVLDVAGYGCGGDEEFFGDGLFAVPEPQEADNLGFPHGEVVLEQVLLELSGRGLLTGQFTDFSEGLFLPADGVAHEDDGDEHEAHVGEEYLDPLGDLEVGEYGHHHPGQDCAVNGECFPFADRKALDIPQQKISGGWRAGWPRGSGWSKKKG